MEPEFIIDISLTEIIGKAGLAAALELAWVCQFPLSESRFQTGSDTDFHPMTRALETLYGSQVGAGIAYRAGRVSFKYFLAVFGAKLGFSDLDFRLLPLNKRKMEGLFRISKEMFTAYGMESTIRDEKTWIAVEIQNCVECKGEKSLHPSCHFVAGFLQEYLAWMGGGRFFAVQETTCRANGGSSCTFELSKQPLD
jgi:bacteriochlorophyll 4-vinyl reductase